MYIIARFLSSYSTIFYSSRRSFSVSLLPFVQTRSECSCSSTFHLDPPLGCWTFYSWDRFQQVGLPRHRPLIWPDLETWKLFLPPMCLQRGSGKDDESNEQEGDRRKLKAVTCIRDPLVERSAVRSVMPFAYPFGWGLRTSNEE